MGGRTSVPSPIAQALRASLTQVAATRWCSWSGRNAATSTFTSGITGPPHPEGIDCRNRRCRAANHRGEEKPATGSWSRRAVLSNAGGEPAPPRPRRPAWCVPWRPVHELGQATRHECQLSPSPHSSYHAFLPLQHHPASARWVPVDDGFDGPPAALVNRICPGPHAIVRLHAPSQRPARVLGNRPEQPSRLQSPHEPRRGVTCGELEPPLPYDDPRAG